MKRSQICMFDIPLEENRPRGRNSYTPDKNPMLIWGPGPEGKKCKHCSNMVRKRLAKTYLKCAIRPNTNGSKTDIRANWPACAKFEEAGDE